jgi:hypothetical protein
MVTIVKCLPAPPPFAVLALLKGNILIVMGKYNGIINNIVLGDSLFQTEFSPPVLFHSSHSARFA